MQAQKIVFNLHVDNPMNAGMMRPGLNQAEIVEIETAAEIGRNFEMNVVVFRSETFAQAGYIIVIEACATAVFCAGYDNSRKSGSFPARTAAHIPFQ